MASIAELKKRAKEKATGTSQTTTEEKKPMTKNYPVKNLMMKGDEGLLTVTGMWEKETKNGDKFFSGFDKNDEIGYSVFPTKTGYALKANAGGEFSTLVKDLQERESKKGEKFLAGKTEEGVEYLVFDYKRKDPK